MEKRQFRIGELAKHLGVERFVIRFWEKEFNIRSHRSHGGQRFYIDNDLQLFQKIKVLLYDQGFTIAGAKQLLKNDGSDKQFIASKKALLEPPPSSPSSETLDQLDALKKQLVKLQRL